MEEKLMKRISGSTQKTTDQNIEQHQSQHPSFFQDRDMEKYYVSHLAILEKTNK